MDTRITVRGYHESVLVITGGTTGIGFASALKFIDAGVRRVAILGRSAKRGDEAVRALQNRAAGVQAIFSAVDANEPGQVEEPVASVHRTLGSIDILVSSTPAPNRPELLHRTEVCEIPEILTTLTIPPMLMTRAVFPIMVGQGGGSIVNISSDAAKVATPGESVLGAAMAAIAMFSRTAAVEGKRDGIRVNIVTPSLVVGTPAGDRILEGGFSKKIFDRAAGMASLGTVKPEDLASLIVFLGGPGASKLTGQTISVTGGISAV